MDQDWLHMADIKRVEVQWPILAKVHSALMKRILAPASVAQLVGHCPEKWQSIRSPIWFPVTAHAWVVGSVPGRGTCERQPIN